MNQCRCPRQIIPGMESARADARESPGRHWGRGTAAGSAPARRLAPDRRAPPRRPNSMSKIHIVRQHTLSLEDARAEVERIAQRVESELGADYAWDGDTLSFARSGISGHITVTEDALDLTIRLGLLLSALKGQIEEQIASKVDETLAARGAVPPPEDTD
ncbi:hypothetical protein CKO31_07635 [Thiohalocapsa halophila]|uniref:Polyhydroxyalkanoic acid synthase n=2 Tax=Thiohalocapsa halophila TaxID=69359 RepID=A0ABS1CFD2_9GAMM|nr:hypothetical protein [Thiohalocapsa halophila]